MVTLPWRVRVCYPPRSHRMPKTFDKTRLIIARDDNHGRTMYVFCTSKITMKGGHPMIESSIAALMYFNFLVFGILFYLIGGIGLSGRVIVET